LRDPSYLFFNTETSKNPQKSQKNNSAAPFRFQNKNRTKRTKLMIQTKKQYSAILCLKRFICLFFYVLKHRRYLVFLLKTHKRYVFSSLSPSKRPKWGLRKKGKSFFKTVYFYNFLSQFAPQKLARFQFWNFSRKLKNRFEYSDFSRKKSSKSAFENVK